jgi:ribosomal protein L11 methylase PrmA
VQVGLDIEADAVHASEHNAQLNDVQERCQYFTCDPLSPESAGTDSFHAEDSSFDLCLANIFQQDLIRLRDSICRLVRPRGTVVMSGLLKHQVCTLFTMS